MADEIKKTDEDYLPIEHHGIIGNMSTIALVGSNGCIDWFCYPHFDSPSIFASILDCKKGGCWNIAPVNWSNAKQFYWPDTNVLVTRFFTNDGVGEITDYMPKNAKKILVRRMHVVRGKIEFAFKLTPAFDYGRKKHTVKLVKNGAIFQTDDIKIQLSSELSLQTDGSSVFSKVVISENQTVVNSFGSPEENYHLTREKENELFLGTVNFWRKWLSKCTYKGRWREQVYRSALALKLLCFEETGAIVAAPTTSLPESIGGERNWDYRFTWIRDSAFTLYALLRIGFTEEATAFMKFLEDRIRESKDHPCKSGPLRLMYRISGGTDMKEEILSHFEGYKKSSPVRIGNDASEQLQLDIYGEIMDSVYLYNKYGIPISYDFWTHLVGIIDWLADNWNQPDEGVWEFRIGRKHYVYSKVMCWVAFDRALRLADKRSFPAPNRERWLKIRDQIYLEIMQKGWNDKMRSFVQYYGSETLDASNLIMPLVFFISPNDPRMMSTLENIMKSPAEGGLVSNSLVFRYNSSRSPDGLDGEEGTFNICSFWYIEALARAGQLDHKMLMHARLVFEEMIGYESSLSLFAEETGHNGDQLGNFPQAFTHLSLISAAFNLDRALSKNNM